MATARERAVSLEAAPRPERRGPPAAPALPAIPSRAASTRDGVALPDQPVRNSQESRSTIVLPEPARADPGAIRVRPALSLPVPASGREPTPVAASAPRSTTEASRRPSARLILAAGCTVAVAAIAVTYATAHSDHPSSSDGRAAAVAPNASSENTATTGARPAPSTSPGSPTAPAPSSTHAAVGWADANLPRTTAVVAQGAIATQLTGKGFSAVASSTAKPAYLIGDATELRAQAGASLYARSVAVAQFGSGTATVQVRSVLTMSADRGQAALASDRANRVLAGSALASNPQLSAPPDVLDVIRSGDLDLRAATFLALVASDIRVRLEAVPLDAAEAAVSRPHRVLVIAASGAAATAVRNAAKALPDDYAPASIGLDGSGSIVLTWSPSAQPVVSVS